MKKNTIQTYKFKIDFELDLDIQFLGIRMFTETSSELFVPEDSSENISFPELTIIIENQLEEFESCVDGVPYSRPRLLVALGVLSYFTQHIFTPFDSFESSSNLGIFDRKCTNRFVCKNINLFEHFKEFESKIKTHNDKEFIYSLLDRWRKALYMETQSDENMLYNDETLLAYFHILELLTTKYFNAQKREIKSKIEDFTRLLLEESFLLDFQLLTSESTSKSKIIEKLLLPQLSISSKMFYMFKKQGILSDRLKSFVNDFVKIRNAIAHGRYEYQDRVIFPVPPFFPLAVNNFSPMEFYRILTAKTIANYVGISLYSIEWDEVFQNMIPTFEELKQFQIDKKYIGLSNKDFCCGIINNITPLVIAHYLIIKKLKETDALEILTPFIQNYSEVEDETYMSIWAIIIILDILEKGELKDKSINIIKVAEKNNWHPSHFKMRDEMYTLEYLGFKVKELRKLIENGEII